MGQLNPAANNLMRQAQLITQRRQMYLEAFLAKTGLQPNEACMLYGEEIIEQAGKLMKQFKVRFVRHNVAEELATLENQVADLSLKNHAMQMVISVLATKADVSSEKLVELLQMAEKDLLGQGEEPVADKAIHCLGVEEPAGEEGSS